MKALLSLIGAHLLFWVRPDLKYVFKIVEENILHEMTKSSENLVKMGLVESPALLKIHLKTNRRKSK